MKQFLSYMKNLRDRWSNGSELRTASQSMCMHRYFEVPDDEIEIPRILEDLATLFSECRAICGSDSLDWLYEIMRIGIARIDYALIEKGRDFGTLICELHNVYYDRQLHLSCSGHSDALIKYYLKKYAIVIKSKEHYLSKEDSGQLPSFGSTIEYKDAVKHGLCDVCGCLLVSKAKYTRFAVAKYKIKSTYQDDWKRFDNIFVDKKGHAISFNVFLQSCRDQDIKLMKSKIIKEFPALLKHS